MSDRAFIKIFCHYWTLLYKYNYCNFIIKYITFLINQIVIVSIIYLYIYMCVQQYQK